jgi:glycosyltransferase involved in cell wall biosynthesis
MLKILQINIYANKGSTGRIAEEIGELILNNGWKSYIAHGRGAANSQSEIIKIGNKFDIYNHLFKSRFLDRHGLASTRATRDLIQKISEVSPDIIHLHNIHGYYLNFRILFEYLKESNYPVVWTLHDCWSFTGHCAHYTFAGCNKWKSLCNKCPQLNTYPASYFLDSSEFNFKLKQKLFTSLKNLTIVPVSRWLEGEVRKSFLKNEKLHLITNGVNLEKFKIEPINAVEAIKTKYSIGSKPFCLGVSSQWLFNKGLGDFLRLRQILDENYQIVLVGLNRTQIKKLPEGIVGIEHTDNINDLSLLYNAAEVFINFSREETFGLVSLESLACGTPVIACDSTATAEAITKDVGFSIKPGDLESVKYIIESGSYKLHSMNYLRNYVVENFDKNITYNNYLHLYKSLLKV